MVERVAQAMHALGLKVFLDRWYLAPGSSWPEALERALASCRAVAVLLGPSGMGPWQQREQYRALDRQAKTPDFPVIPVVLPGTEDLALGFLGLNTWVDLRSDLERGLGLLAKAVHGEPAGPAGQGPDPRAAICPYRGLQPFREEDAPFFRGREAFTAALLERVASRQLIAVVGASGSGKSSVVRAGLVPALRRGAENGRVWDVAVLRPGRDPIQALAAALLPPDPEMDEFDRIALLRRRAGQLASGDVRLPEVIARMIERQPGTDRVLLVVDQAEELFTLAEEATRGRFVDLLLNATQLAPLTVILTLRGDFYGRALEHRMLADRLDRGVVNLGPMTRDELARAVREPAEQVGLEFDDGLVQRILADVGSEPGNLPLLEFLLEGLWQKRARGRLAHHDYDALGGVAGAIATRADAEYRRLTAEQQLAARRFLVRLVAPGEGREDTRAVAEVPEGDPLLGPVVQQFADARLLVTDRNSAHGKELVEVSHEALIRSWTELRRWVDEDREFLRTLRRAQEAKAIWSAEGCTPDRLLQPGRLLGEAEELMERRPDFVDGNLRHYIGASRRRTRRAAQGRKLVAAGAVALALVASIAAWGAKQSRGEAERQRLVAEENRALAEQKARGLEAALADLQANLIWSNLELSADPLGPEEIDALWRLATTDAAVRTAFLRQFGENRSAVFKFARHPAPVMRALGLILSDEEAQALLGPVLQALKDTTDPNTLLALAKAVRTIPAQATSQQAKAALGSVLAGFARTRDPYALQALAAATQELGVQLSPEQGEAALAPVLERFADTNDPYALRALATAARSVSAQLISEHAQAALAPILSGFTHTNDPYALQALAEAAQALPVPLTSEQARAALNPILAAFDANTEADALQSLVQAVGALAPNLEPVQAQLLLGTILKSLGTNTRPEALGPLIQAAKALDPTLLVDTPLDALRVARSGLAGARSGTEAVAWATALNAMLPAADSSVGDLIEALKYPNSALQNRKVRGGDPVSAEGYLLDVLAEGAAAQELQGGNFERVLAWLAKHHPEVDLARPPSRPAPVDQALAASRSR